MKLRQVSAMFVALLSAGALLPTCAWSEDVGAAAAVKPSSTGTPPGGNSRTLDIGARIASQERIHTDGTGSLQVMFLDKTTLTIGPSSDLVVDQFVYNPSASTGQFAASLSKGALRFVGGQISHNIGATINTPAATIGIRGGVAYISHLPCSQTETKKNLTGNCTKVVNMGGKVEVKSLLDNHVYALGPSGGVEIGGGIQATTFEAQTVRLNDLAAGAQANSTVTPASTNSTNQGGTGDFTSASDTIGRTVMEQHQAEPVAPPPPSLPNIPDLPSAPEPVPPPPVP